MTVAKVAESIRTCADDVIAFREYADADVVLERIEFVVYELSAAIDAAIQAEIDRG